MRIIIFGILTLIAGCTKEPGTKIDGKAAAGLLTQKEWLLTAHGIDDNNNGMIDENENLIQDCQKDNSYKFNPAGMGTYSDNAISCGGENQLEFSWKLLDNNKELEISFERLTILRLDEYYLILKPQSQGGVENYFLVYRH